jgi:hypothetical protein
MGGREYTCLRSAILSTKYVLTNVKAQMGMRMGMPDENITHTKRVLRICAYLRERRERERVSGEMRRAGWWWWFSAAEAGRSEGAQRTVGDQLARTAEILLSFSDGSGQNLGLSGGDPPNPPCGRRGRT